MLLAALLLLRFCFCFCFRFRFRRYTDSFPCIADGLTPPSSLSDTPSPRVLTNFMAKRDGIHSLEPD